MPKKDHQVDAKPAVRLELVQALQRLRHQRSVLRRHRVQLAVQLGQPAEEPQTAPQCGKCEIEPDDAPGDDTVVAVMGRAFSMAPTLLRRRDATTKFDQLTLDDDTSHAQDMFVLPSYDCVSNWSRFDVEL